MANQEFTQNLRPRVGRLHVLTDTRWHLAQTHADLARLALSAGADVVQIRAKLTPSHQLAAWANALESHRQNNGLSGIILINDDVDAAKKSATTGVHLGQEDMPPATARQLLGPDKIVGATVHNLAELEAIMGLDIDYIGVGPVFGTQSKDTGLPPLGLDGLAALCARSPFPVIAIGSINTAEQVAQVMQAGAYGLAVISAVWSAPDPTAAIAHLKAAIEPNL